jgi:hypothetical protein
MKDQAASNQKDSRKKLAAAIVGGGTVCILALAVAGNWLYNKKYMAPVATRHVNALVSASISEDNIDSLLASLKSFNSGTWKGFLTQEQEGRVADLTKKVEEVSRIRDQIRRAKQTELEAKARAVAQAEEESRNPDFKATLTNYFVDAAPDTFRDRIAQVRDGVLTVGDVKCKLSGETVRGEGGCTVQMRDGRPISAKWWLDDDMGYHVYSTATFGKQVKRGSYNPEKAADPYVAIQQTRLNTMIQDFHKEQENARKNCKGLRGDAWIYCAGAQAAD